MCPKADELLEIDGSLGEGGGQLVRTSIALSALLDKPIHIFNVRSKRSPPGFRAQHMTGVRAVAALVKARIDGLEMGSMELTFEPRVKQSGTFTFDVGTAGSISLVLQALMPTVAFAPGPVRFELIGGTDVRWSPTIDYIKNVTLPVLAKMGYDGMLTVVRRGHYPRGGGRVIMVIQPSRRLKPITLTEFGGVSAIRGVSHCVRLPSYVAERQAKAATQALHRAGYGDVEIETEWYPPQKDPHLGPGSGIVVYAKTTTGAILGADALGERGKPAEKVGEEAAEKLLEELRTGMPVDRHMGDMLIPYMAVAEGISEIRVSKMTLHLLTNVQIAEAMAGVKFGIEGKLEGSGKVVVQGLGLKNPSLF